MKRALLIICFLFFYSCDKSTGSIRVNVNFPTPTPTPTPTSQNSQNVKSIEENNNDENILQVIIN